jgi:hypothetical protein
MLSQKHLERLLILMRFQKDMGDRLRDFEDEGLGGDRTDLYLELFALLFSYLPIR